MNKKDNTQMSHTSTADDDILFQVENGKIKRFREYFNPAPFKHAFGLDEGESFYKE